ncbi:MAG: AIR carboxylase family protein [Candidatus Diapherotrites archaeon]|nr:AIR carboxylase family protein [Candidatus Diapherotrites archaeon]
MRSLLVVFGSESDQDIYSPLLSELHKKGISFSFRILSAHKTPQELHQAIQTEKFDLVICGAGLAAALPGAMAAQTLKPVIGIPCRGALDGLDALLSIQQMPPGVPVIAVGVEQIQWAARLAREFLNARLTEINLLRPQTIQEQMLFSKSKEFLNELGISFQEANQPAPNAVNVLFKELHHLQEIPESESVLLVVPAIHQCHAPDAMHLLEATRKHYWVGINNYRNAVLAAVQLINGNGSFTPALQKYRQKSGEKVLEADRKTSRV